MKYRLRLAAIVVGLLGFVSAYAYAQSTPSPIPTETPAASSVIQQDIFVRGGPGRDYLPVGKLLAGDHVRPLSRNAQNDWVLIVYGKGYGWIRRDLAFWVENIDALPVMEVANLTPSPVIPTTPSATPILLPTFTPEGNWVQLGGDAQSGLVRAGPGRTYLRLGQLLTGDSVEPVAQNTDGSWIMIRYQDGFGWIARSLVHWENNLDMLPVVDEANLTPTATFTATNTATATSTATNTNTPTSTLTATLTPTVTPSVTATDTPLPTLTYTPFPTPTATSTATLVPSVTATSTATVTNSPTVEPSATNTSTVTVVPTNMPTVTSVVEAVIASSATDTPLPTITETVAPTSTSSPTVAPPTNTSIPSATFTETPTVTATATLTAIPPSSTSTSTSLATYTETRASVTTIPVTQTLAAARVTATVIEPTQTVTKAITATPRPEQTQIAAGGITALTPTASPLAMATAPNSGLSPEVLVAGIALILIVIYAVLYWRGASETERYASGFVIDTCPVCHRGHLIVESRQERLFGIPHARHSVRCTECRSVLREVSDEHWRYAVDPIENPELFQQLNGQVIDDQTLIELARNGPQAVPHPKSSSQTPPNFIDDDT